MQKFILTASVLLVATTSYAQDLPSPKTPKVASVVPSSNAILNVNNEISLQFVLNHFDYKETGDGRLDTPIGLLDTEKGYVPGFGVSASLMKNWIFDNFYLYADYQRSSGKTSYVGSYAFGNVCAPASIPFCYGSVKDKDGAITDNFDLRIGKGFALDDHFMVTPYLGAGHYSWDRKVNFGEEYRNFYYGAGLMAQFSPVSNLVLSTTGLVGRTFDSQIDVHGGAAVGAVVAIPVLIGFSGGLGNSTIVKLGASADYALADNIHINAGVDSTNFKFGESAVYGNIPRSWEPNSKSAFITYKLGLGYSF